MRKELKWNRRGARRTPPWIDSNRMLPVRSSMVENPKSELACDLEERQKSQNTRPEKKLYSRLFGTGIGLRKRKPQ